ncbi:sugar-binding transcriptional regulator [Thalassospira alkalitolerans]|uniref:sugar-binding transcriptional regulator n=1 Tax=Thalassospira alkalitolerans TaxID=1293890 RepID=UPI0030ED8D77|tara:strand:+ start:284154 stop:285119 length:966 start_codon:yes stop_codon:yes gene_type:complete
MSNELHNDSESEAFLAEVCWHYFINEMTQSEVARLLGITRLRVNQAIKTARETGLVRVEIQSFHTTRLSLQQRLKNRLDLAEVIVAPANREAHDYHQPVGAALAALLANGLREGQWKSIGVSWGMTLKNTITRLPRLSLPEVEIVSMIGGTSEGASFNAFGVASGFADRLGAKYALFAAPIYLSPSADRSIFLSDAVFQRHLKKLTILDVAVLVAGDLSDKSFLMSSAVPPHVTAGDLAAKGAVGDILGRFLNAHGNEIDHEINSCAVGMDLEELSKVPERVLAAAGKHKVEIIIAAIRRGLVTTLVTDDITAELILEKLE